MKVLVIGGAGFIGTGITEYAVKYGHQVTAITRHKHTWHEVTDRVNSIQSDWMNDKSARKILNNKHYDIIVDGLIMTKKQMERDIQLINGHCKHFFFISSAGVYNQPGENVREDTPIDSDKIYWSVMQNKREIELYLENIRKQYNFMVTVIRPSVTYGDTRIPCAVLSRKNQLTLVQRVIDGKPIIFADDNNSLHPISRIDVFAKAVVSLFGKAEADGQTYHIADEQSYTWDDVAKAIGKAVNKKIQIIHINVEKLKSLDPNLYIEVKYNKFDTLTLDISKIKQMCPEEKFHTDLNQDLKNIISNIKKVNANIPLDDRFNRISDILIADYISCGGNNNEKKIAKNYISSLDDDYVKSLPLLRKKIERDVIRQQRKQVLKDHVKEILPDCIVSIIILMKKTIFAK